MSAREHLMGDVASAFAASSDLNPEQLYRNVVVKVDTVVGVGDWSDKRRWLISAAFVDVIQCTVAIEGTVPRASPRLAVRAC